MRFTPAQKNGAKPRHRSGHDSPPPPRVSPEERDKWPKENKRGETGYFSKKGRAEVSNYIHPETSNLGGAAAR